MSPMLFFGLVFCPLLQWVEWGIHRKHKSKENYRTFFVQRKERESMDYKPDDEHVKVIAQIDEDVLAMPMRDRILYEIAGSKFDIKTPSELYDKLGLLIGRQVLADNTFKYAVTDMLLSDGPFPGMGDTKIDRVYEFVDMCIENARPLVDDEIAQFNEALANADNESRTFRPYSLAELAERPAKEWLIDGMFGTNEIGMIYGLPASGKSFVLVDFAIECAIGGMVADRFDVKRPLNVAYFAGEGVAGMSSRFVQACTDKNVNMEIGNISFFELVPQLHDMQSPEAAIVLVQEQLQYQANGGKPFDIIIIDTLHTATVGVDENSAQDMGKVLATIKYINKSLNTNVLLAHHTNKGGEQERGSVAMRGSMDVMIKTAKVAGKHAQFLMKCEKLKDDDRWQKQTFHLRKGEHSASLEWEQPKEIDEVEQEAIDIEERAVADIANTIAMYLRKIYPDQAGFKQLRKETKDLSAKFTQRRFKDACDKAIEEGDIVTYGGGKGRPIMHSYNPDLVDEN